MSDTLLMPISTSKTPQRGISAASALRVMKASFLPIRCAMITGFVLALIVSLVPIPALAAPVTVQFEGQAPAGDEVLGVALYSESGFNFNQLGSGDDDFRILSSTFPGLNLSGTDVGFVQEPGNFRITESAGAPFCATSLQLGGGLIVLEQWF